MNYQFVILGCGIVFLFFTIIGMYFITKQEIKSLKESIDELSSDLKIILEKIEHKRNEETKDLNLRLEAIYTKLDSLIWRILNNQNQQ